MAEFTFSDYWDSTSTTGSADVWPIWTNTSASTWTATITIGIDPAWQTWTCAGSTDSTFTISTAPVENAIVWQTWCDPNANVIVYPGSNPFSVPAVPVAARRNVDELRKKRRARALLRRVLSPAQWADWERYLSVRVVAASGSLYDVVDGWAYRIQGEVVIDKFCWHGVGGYCLEDRIAAFVLKLRTAESVFLMETEPNSFNPYEQQRVLLRREGRRLLA